MDKKKILRALIVVCLLAAASGCASIKPQPVYSIWPAFPAEPKLVFEAVYRGGEDVKAPTFVDYLLGKSVVLDFTKPYGVYADQDRVYVVETQFPNPSLVILDKQKGRSKIVPGGDFGMFKTPIGVAAVQNGDIYVSDTVLGGVYVFDKDGGYQVALDKPGTFKRPAGMTIDNNLKRLYIADAGADTVRVYSLDGKHLFDIGSSGSGPGKLHSPTNVAIDRGNGNVAVVDTLNWRVQIFDSEGKFVRSFGELGDNPGQFTRPKGIGIDSEGHIYVADAAYDNVQIFTPDGKFLGFFGSAGSDVGYFFELPSGLYIDDIDKIYIADQLNSRVQVFQYLSDAWKKANPDTLAAYKKVQEEEANKTAKTLEEKKKKKEAEK